MTPSSVVGSSKQMFGFVPAASAVLLMVVALYWPLTHAGIVWDDRVWFYKQAWLREGNGWIQFMFHGFFQWTNYFRPLIVALFTFETRFFQGAPALMHVVSLCIHLVNTLLVGLLARRMCAPPGSTVSRSTATLAMALFGLHAALVEPIAWVSCQFDLAVTLFMLLGLYVNMATVGQGWRAAGVAGCFFLAACSKEFAVSFPILLVLADATRVIKEGNSPTIQDILHACWRRQKTIYLAVFATGLAYLGLRYCGLGFLTVPAAVETISVFARFQTVCFVYTHYLRLIIWPMYGLSPVHVVETKQFATASLSLIARDASAMLILGGAIYLALRRNLLGILVLASTAALFPALHVIPVAFDPSLYHERYAMPAIAMACIWMPGLLRDPSARFAPHPLTRIVPIALAAWLAASVLNIAVTLPLWSDDILLWQWTAKEQPGIVAPLGQLLAIYVERNDPRARVLADRLVAEHPECSNCMLNAAYLALFERDVPRAEIALKHLQQAPELAIDKSLYSGYILAVGQMLELQRDFVESEQAYHRAIELAPYDPQPEMQLALLLARERRTGEASSAANKAIELFPPSERSGRRSLFEQVLAQSAATTGPP
jgi:tetratricopeptide (TPR) repeat protein